MGVALLVLIDNYIDERVLTLLAERRAGVACHIYGKNAAKRDVQLAYSRYQQQYPNDTLQLTQWNDAHDRFIVCDDTIWLCGASVDGVHVFENILVEAKGGEWTLVSEAIENPGRRTVGRYAVRFDTPVAEAQVRIRWVSGLPGKKLVKLGRECHPHEPLSAQRAVLLRSL